MCPELHPSTSWLVGLHLLDTQLFALLSHGCRILVLPYQVYPLLLGHPLHLRSDRYHPPQDTHRPPPRPRLLTTVSYSILKNKVHTHLLYVYARKKLKNTL